MGPRGGEPGLRLGRVDGFEAGNIVLMRLVCASSRVLASVIRDWLRPRSAWIETSPALALLSRLVARSETTVGHRPTGR